MLALRGWAERKVEHLDAERDPEEVLEERQQLLERQIKVHGVDGGPTANARGDVAR